MAHSYFAAAFSPSSLLLLLRCTPAMMIDKIWWVDRHAVFPIDRFPSLLSLYGIWNSFLFIFSQTDDQYHLRLPLQNIKRHLRFFVRRRLLLRFFDAVLYHAARRRDFLSFRYSLLALRMPFIYGVYFHSMAPPTEAFTRSILPPMTGYIFRLFIHNAFDRPGCILRRACASRLFASLPSPMSGESSNPVWVSRSVDDIAIEIYYFERYMAYLFSIRQQQSFDADLSRDRARVPPLPHYGHICAWARSREGCFLLWMMEYRADMSFDYALPPVEPRHFQDIFAYFDSDYSARAKMHDVVVIISRGETEWRKCFSAHLTRQRFILRFPFTRALMVIGWQRLAAPLPDVVARTVTAFVAIL